MSPPARGRLRRRRARQSHREQPAVFSSQIILWEGFRRLEKLPVRGDPGLVADAQEQILKTARAMRESPGALAGSKTLIAAIERLERDIAARG